MEKPPDRNVFDVLGITPDYFSKVVEMNPSLRGVLIGYIAETKLRDVFALDKRTEGLRKEDDHDRSNKNDLVVTYKGFDFTIEVKSLQTNLIEMKGHDGSWIKKIIRQNGKYVRNPLYQQQWNEIGQSTVYRGKVQCDASDRREVKFPDGSTLLTTCLLVGEFDILATGLFAFREKWDFAFALNRDLPRSNCARYTPKQKEQLLASGMPVSLPIERPYESDPFILFDFLLEEKRLKKS